MTAPQSTVAKSNKFKKYELILKGREKKQC